MGMDDVCQIKRLGSLRHAGSTSFHRSHYLITIIIDHHNRLVAGNAGDRASMLFHAHDICRYQVGIYHRTHAIMQQHNGIYVFMILKD